MNYTYFDHATEAASYLQKCSPHLVFTIWNKMFQTSDQNWDYKIKMQKISQIENVTGTLKFLLSYLEKGLSHSRSA